MPSRRSTPTVPPGFEAQMANESRRSTPVIPPGFEGSKPSALPAYLEEEAGQSRPPSRPSSRASLKRQASNQQILPVLPLRPVTPIARPSTPSRGANEPREAAANETPTKSSKSTTGRAELSMSEESRASDAPPDSPSAVEKENKAPAQEVSPKAATSMRSGRAKAASTDAPATMERPATRNSSAIQTSNTKAGPVTPEKPVEKKNDASKRKHPGKLDITAAVNKQQEAAASSRATQAETPNKAPRSVSQAFSTIPKPESPSVSSPLVKGAARTLRVVQTPKAETPPPQAGAGPPPVNLPGAVAAVSKLPSRQPSVASTNVPGTPSSEHVSMSDNISMTSTSLSRANTPPPTGAGAANKVGSAPVRAKTKSQMRKERQERAKALEEEKAKLDEVAKPTVEEPAQEAIVSRKKKTKKEKEPKPPKSKATKDTAPKEGPTQTAKRAASPGKKKSPSAPPAVPSKPDAPTRTPVPTSRPSPVPVPHEPSPPPTPTLTAASLLAELRSQAPEVQKCIDSLFRTPTSAHFKSGQPILPKDLQNPAAWKYDYQNNLSKEDLDALLRSTVSAIHYGGQDGRIWDRGMITPTGSHLRALTEELEARFLDLEKALREVPEELRFRPSKPQNEIKFPHIDLEALKRQFDNINGRGVSVMEQMVQDGSTLKKGAFLVDEASKYLNEFVMPPASPPPSAGNGAAASSGSRAAPQAGAGGVDGLGSVSLDIAERQLNEARRMSEEREGQLKKMIKKNKRLLGLG